MKKFDGQLLRLKEVLGLTEDRQAAAALGLGQDALAQRKRRDAFPEDKLFVLKTKMPDLDDFYVLTGERRSSTERLMHDVMAAATVKLNDKNLSKSVAQAAQNLVDMEQAALQSPMMRRLLNLAMFCTDDDVEALCRAAHRMIRPGAVPIVARAEQTPPPSKPSAIEVGSIASSAPASRRSEAPKASHAVTQPAPTPAVSKRVPGRKRKSPSSAA